MTAVITHPTSEQQQEFPTPVAGGLVVGFDGSLASYAALDSAGAIAREKRWPVHVVSVLPPMSSYKTNPGLDEPRSEIEDLRFQLRDAAIRDAIGPASARNSWTRQVVVGFPATEIARIAQSRCADLIVLGRSRRAAVDLLFGADTTTQAISNSSIPLLIVEAEMKKPSTVVAAIDFRPASVRAAATALELLGATGTLYLVYVDEPVKGGAGTGTPTRDEYPGEAVALFNKVIAQLRPSSGVLVETIVLNGTAAFTIAEFCERVGADMLTVGTRGLSRPARVVLGSVSLGVVRNVRLPIVIAPAKA
jgi:nucleotide-binding universal stress UspA family protein